MTISRQVITAVTARAFFPLARSRTNWLKLLEEEPRRRNVSWTRSRARLIHSSSFALALCIFDAVCDPTDGKFTVSLPSPSPSPFPGPRRERPETIARPIVASSGSPSPLPLALSENREETLHEPIGDNQSPSGTSPRRVGSGVARRSRGLTVCIWVRVLICSNLMRDRLA